MALRCGKVDPMRHEQSTSALMGRSTGGGLQKLLDSFVLTERCRNEAPLTRGPKPFSQSLSAGGWTEWTSQDGHLTTPLRLRGQWLKCFHLPPCSARGTHFSWKRRLALSEENKRSSQLSFFLNILITILYGISEHLTTFSMLLRICLPRWLRDPLKLQASKPHGPNPSSKLFLIQHFLPRWMEPSPVLSLKSETESHVRSPLLSRHVVPSCTQNPSPSACHREDTLPDAEDTGTRSPSAAFRRPISHSVLLNLSTLFHTNRLFCISTATVTVPAVPVAPVPGHGHRPLPSPQSPGSPPSNHLLSEWPFQCANDSQVLLLLKGPHRFPWLTTRQQNLKPSAGQTRLLQSDLRSLPRPEGQTEGAGAVKHSHSGWPLPGAHSPVWAWRMGLKWDWSTSSHRNLLSESKSDTWQRSLSPTLLVLC